MSNLFLKKARALFRAGFALVIGAMLFAACDSGSSDGEEAGAANPLKAFSVHGIAGNIDAVKKTVNVAVPYFEGIDVSALDVEVSAEEGAVVIPLSSGTADFSAPKTFTITADGVSTEYTVTVYVLFDGEEGLTQLYDYADPDAKLYTIAQPAYIALSGINFDDGDSATAAIKTALRNQYAALDLSRCMGEAISAGKRTAPFLKAVSVIFPDTVKYLTVSSAPDGSLFNTGGDNSVNNTLVSVTLPASLEIIGQGAFMGCRNLTAIEFPASLKKIDYAAFWGSGLESVEFNEGLEEIGNFAFSNGSSSGNNLKSAKFPSTLKKIGATAFYGNKFTEVDLSKTKVEYLGTQTFAYCPKLESVKLPATLKYTSGVPNMWNTFQGDAALKSLDLSETGISYLGIEPGGFGRANTGEGFIDGCAALETLVLPAALDTIHIWAEPSRSTIFGAAQVKSLVVKAVTPPAVTVWDAGKNLLTGYAFWGNSLASDAAIYVPDGSVTAYHAAANWSAYAGVIKGLSQWAGK